MTRCPVSTCQRSPVHSSPPLTSPSAPPHTNSPHLLTPRHASSRLPSLSPTLLSSKASLPPPRQHWRTRRLRGRRPLLRWRPRSLEGSMRCQRLRGGARWGEGCSEKFTARVGCSGEPQDGWTGGRFWSQGWTAGPDGSSRMSGSGRAVPGPHTSAAVMAGEGEGGGHASSAASLVTPLNPFSSTPSALHPSLSPH